MNFQWSGSRRWSWLRWLVELVRWHFKSEAFPHRNLSLEAGSAMADLGFGQTPLAIVVGPSGAVVKVEALAGRSASAILQLLGTT